MSSTIFLYGSGEVPGGQRVDSCYLKCEIPDAEDQKKNGLFPTVLHSYVMYAKDIGLEISEIVLEGFKSLDDVKTQLVYSLFPILYVNNSDIFTERDAPGIRIWSKVDAELECKYSVRLNKKLAYFYEDKAPDAGPPPNLGLATEASNPEPLPNNIVHEDGSWKLELVSPKKEDSGNKASTYSIIEHYSRLVVWDTLKDMTACTIKRTRLRGLKEANGHVLQSVMKRKMAYDPIEPAWSNTWGAKPDWYDKKRIASNNYNIGASFFLFDSVKDPDSPHTSLDLFGTALNIKGKIKAGHAETRLLLALNTLDFYKYDRDSLYERLGFYEFDEGVDFVALARAIDKRQLTLISSLKPCYMCIGESDASEEGLVHTIDGRPVNMWNSYPNVPLNTDLRLVMYFDVDRPIEYYSNINVQVRVGGQLAYIWSFEISRWSEWSNLLNYTPSVNYLGPIGPRIVEPAGECLKTGEAYTRYLNSSYLLLTDRDKYLESVRELTTEKKVEHFED